MERFLISLGRDADKKECPRYSSQRDFRAGSIEGRLGRRQTPLGGELLRVDCRVPDWVEVALNTRGKCVHTERKFFHVLVSFSTIWINQSPNEITRARRTSVSSSLVRPLMSVPITKRISSRRRLRAVEPRIRSLTILLVIVCPPFLKGPFRAKFRLKTRLIPTIHRLYPNKNRTLVLYSPSARPLLARTAVPLYTGRLKTMHLRDSQSIIRVARVNT